MELMTSDSELVFVNQLAKYHKREWKLRKAWRAGIVQRPGYWYGALACLGGGGALSRLVWESLGNYSPATQLISTLVSGGATTLLGTYLAMKGLTSHELDQERRKHYVYYRSLRLLSEKLSEERRKSPPRVPPNSPVLKIKD